MALLDELRVAFPPVPLDATGAFAWYSDAELCERAVTGKTWEHVDPRLVDRSDSLAFLSTERFVAWLPMYLNHLVTTAPERSAIFSTLLRRLAPERRFGELADRLTSGQRRVVARCLQFVCSIRPGLIAPQQALDRCWAQYASTPTFREDPLLEELRAAFVPTVMRAEDVFIDADWEHCGTFEYRQAVDGRTWEQLDRIFLVEEVHSFGVLSDGVARAVLPAYLHLAAVFAMPTEPVVARLTDPDALNAPHQHVVARYMQQLAPHVFERYWGAFA